MPPGLELGEEQGPVHFHFEAASVRRLQTDGFDLGFEGLEQVGRQVHGPVSVVSDGAIFNIDLE